MGSRVDRTARRYRANCRRTPHWIIAAADGSFKDQRGTLGYALVHAPTGQRINGANQVPGEETDQASYQNELTGIYGTLLITQRLCKIHGIDDGHLVVACGNLSAGQKAI
jgi:hypothetical protein